MHALFTVFIMYALSSTKIFLNCNKMNTVSAIVTLPASANPQQREWNIQYSIFFPLVCIMYCPGVKSIYFFVSLDISTEGHIANAK